MKEIEYKYTDKTKWPRGEWDNEPDKVQFTDQTSGMPCLIVRNGGGALCGYVGVSKDHPFFEKDYSSCTLKSAKPRGMKEKDDVPFPDWFQVRQSKRLVCDDDGFCDHTPESILRVHGGITFSDTCQENLNNHGICHIPDEGESDHVWWFGFDCSHFMDYSPAYEERLGKLFTDSTYRNVAYVKSEIAKLAKQLKEIK